jgi:hypothetical protein
MSLPTPSKRPFYHPIPAEALEWFTHPRAGHVYEFPGWGRDGNLYCANGWVAVRFFSFPSSFGTAPMTMVDRLLKLPWRRAQDTSRNLAEPAGTWRALDDCTLDIYRDGIFPMWRDERGGYRVDPAVRINHGALVPAVSLQLIARLPKAEIRTVIDRGEPVAFRFRGGEGLLAQLTHEQQAAASPEVCHIFPSVHHRI